MTSEKQGKKEWKKCFPVPRNTRNVNMDGPWIIIMGAMDDLLTGECIWDVVLDFQVDKQGGHVQGLVLLVPEADVAVSWRRESRPRSVEQNH